MGNDGLFDRFGTPDVVIGQHVAPLPAGAIGMRVGPAFAASDALRVTLYGRGGQYHPGLGRTEALYSHVRLDGACGCAGRH